MISNHSAFEPAKMCPDGRMPGSTSSDPAGTRTNPWVADTRGKPPPQRHIDIAGKLFDGIAVFDDTFYDSLARIIDERC